MITPERSGLCGAYNWLDGKAAFEINPTGPNQPIVKGAIDRRAPGPVGAASTSSSYDASHNAIERFNAYSMMERPDDLLRVLRGHQRASCPCATAS